MGITAYYTVRLKGEGSLGPLIAHVRQFAAAHDWPARAIAERKTTLDRLVRVLGLPEAAVGTGCTYLDAGEFPAGLTLDDFITVG